MNSTAVGFCAIRMDNWKLILGLCSGGLTVPRQIKAKPGEPEFQLYNLKDDPAETQNKAAANPEKVAELSRLLETIKSLNSSN